MTSHSLAVVGLARGALIGPCSSAAYVLLLGLWTLADAYTLHGDETVMTKRSVWANLVIEVNGTSVELDGLRGTVDGTFNVATVALGAQLVRGSSRIYANVGRSSSPWLPGPTSGSSCGPDASGPSTRGSPRVGLASGSPARAADPLSSKETWAILS